MSGRLVFLSQYWRPETGAPQNRLGDFAVLLESNGWRVEVLTAQPNYPKGRVFDGYSKIGWSRDEVDGIPVTRCPLFASRSRRTIARLTCYLSFALSSFLAGMVCLRRGDLLFVESPPLFLGATARLLSMVKRTRFVFNVSDLWPDSAVEMGWVTDGIGVRIAKRLERWIYAGAVALTGQSPTIARELEERSPGKPVLLVTNGVDLLRFDESRFESSWRRKLGATEEDVLVTYAGLHGVAQGLDQILAAADSLRSDTGIRFALVGDGPAKPELLEQAQSLGLPNIVFHDAVGPDDIPGILRSADIAVIPLGFDLTGAVPSKIYEAMAARLPVVLIGGGDGKELVDRQGCGVTCAIGDIEGIAEAIRYLSEGKALRDEMGERGRSLVTQSFDRRTVATELDSFLKAKLDL